MGGYIGRAARCVLPVLALAGCGSINRALDSRPPEGNVGYVRGFLGGVAADEPQAALAARDVLSSGGSAADAAVAGALMMSVTLPSRVGLMGGGACLAYNAARNETDAILFPAARPQTLGGDRPAAVPLFTRGLFALHARHGRRPFESLFSPAEQAARFGTRVSRALARDIAAVSGPLFADPQIRAVFAGPGGGPITEGSQISQPLLGTTLAQLRVAGVGDMYNGTLAQRIEAHAPQAGAAFSVAELRAALPRAVQPVSVPAGNDIVSFLPPPADPSGATQAAFAGGAAAAGGYGGMPASATLVTLDREGNAVTCAFSMNNLWGTGRMLPGTGMVLAAAPDVGAVRAPVLAAGLIHNANRRAFRAAAAGSGQQGAAAAAGEALRALANGQAPASPDPGRFNAIGCPGLVPGREATCRWFTDPRGSGLAVGAD